MKQLLRQVNDCQKSISPPKFPARRGAALVFALMALLVASMLTAALLKTVSLSHRQLIRDEFRLQANLLADAGCERALSRLKQQPETTNDEWLVPSTQLGKGRTASVRWNVAPDASDPQRKSVTVVAAYPLDHVDRVQVTRMVAVE